MKKYSNKKSLSLKLASGILALSVITSPLTACMNETVYEKSNQSYLYNNVLDRISYWGGDSRYIDQNYSPLKMSNSTLATHFENKGRPIVVGYSSKCKENDIEQFNYVVNYFNYLFSIINPNYSLITKNCENESDCDIFIDFKPLALDVGANIYIYNNNLNACITTSALINVNNLLNSTNTALRFYLAHEFLHAFYGSSDVNSQNSRTFSVYNSSDMGFIIRKVDEFENLTDEEKNCFVTLLPVDVATLIAIYGNSESDAEHNKYVDLLNDTVNECSNVFGSYQPYFKKGFTIPEKKILYTTVDLNK